MDKNISEIYKNQAERIRNENIENNKEIHVKDISNTLGNLSSKAIKNVAEKLPNFNEVFKKIDKGLSPSKKSHKEFRKNNNASLEKIMKEEELTEKEKEKLLKELGKLYENTELEKRRFNEYSKVIGGTAANIAIKLIADSLKAFMFDEY